MRKPILIANWKMNGSRATSGAHTGEVNATRFRQVLSADMTPVLCVGETLEEREQDQAMLVIERQLQSVVSSPDYRLHIIVTRA